VVAHLWGHAWLLKGWLVLSRLLGHCHVLLLNVGRLTICSLQPGLMTLEWQIWLVLRLTRQQPLLLLLLWWVQDYPIVACSLQVTVSPLSLQVTKDPYLMVHEASV
jgi:hypothetical protein